MLSRRTTEAVRLQAGLFGTAKKSAALPFGRPCDFVTRSEIIQEKIARGLPRGFLLNQIFVSRETLMKLQIIISENHGEKLGIS
jgi:hypothetical protein